MPRTAWYHRRVRDDVISNPAYERVYHFHVRKTAGTSLNAAFWALGDLRLPDLGKSSDVTGNGLRFVRNNLKLIAKGDYLFANSHAPAYRVNLPPHTFTVTILRDPIARVLSYYRYLLWASNNSVDRQVEPAIDSVREEAKIVGDGLRPFLERISEEHLLTQVFMFSERMDPLEAADRALECTAVCFTETFPKDLAEIASTLRLDLAEAQERRFGEQIAFADAELDALRQKLAPEYAMIERVRNGLRARRSRP